jgi:hypothetical protein
MADKPKVNKTNTSSPLSHADLLASYEWRLIQSIRTRYGENSHTLAGIARHLGTLLRRWDRQLPEAYHLPQVIQDLRDRVLLGRTFQKRPGSVQRFDREEIGRFMYKLLGPADGRRRTHPSVLDAALDAEEKLGCKPGSAKKWYYVYAKKQPG